MMLTREEEAGKVRTGTALQLATNVTQYHPKLFFKNVKEQLTLHKDYLLVVLD